jgi:hypothetical protein
LFSKAGSWSNWLRGDWFLPGIWRCWRDEWLENIAERNCSSSEIADQKERPSNVVELAVHDRKSFSLLLFLELAWRWSRGNCNFQDKDHHPKSRKELKTLDSNKTKNLLTNWFELSLGQQKQRQDGWPPIVHKIAGLHQIAGQGGKGIIWLFCVYLTEESVNRKWLNRNSIWSKIVNCFL